MKDEIKNYLKDNILVFDIDGTLCKYDFPDFGVKCFDEHSWIHLNMLTDVYANAIPIRIFDDIIDSCNPNDLYSLGVAYSSFEQRNKINFMHKNFSKFKDNNIIFVSENKYKYDVLSELMEIYSQMGYTDKKIILIEDNSSIMLDVELKKNSNIHCMLVSDFL